MICRYRVAFLNCHNLLPLGHELAPDHTESGMQARLAALKETLLNACDGETPDVICLCETGTREFGIGIAQQCGIAEPVDRWAEPRSAYGRPPNTGLHILANSRVLDVPGWSGDDFPHGQPRWIAAIIQSRKIDQIPPVAFLVNHWHAPDINGQLTPEQLRGRRKIGSKLASLIRRVQAPDQAIPALVLGDLNIEPFDPHLRTESAELFSDIGLLALRDRDRLLSVITGTDVCLYNPMWRHLGEDAPCDWRRAGLPQPARPPGTHRPRDPELPTQSWRTIDQVLVTPDLLGIGPWRLAESTLRIVPPVSDCSDHCGIGFCIEHVV